MDENRTNIENPHAEDKFHKLFPIIAGVMSVVLVALVVTMFARKNSTPEPQPTPKVAQNPTMPDPQTPTAPPIVETPQTIQTETPTPQPNTIDTDSESDITNIQTFSTPDQTTPEYWDNTPLGNLTSPRIVVEKSKLRLTVFDGDRIAKVYRAAVGGAHGDKNREGDLKTPEGEFFICVKKTNRGPARTPYTRSMGLSYPNIEDARRGLQAGLISQSQHDSIVYNIRRKRQPPWNTKLGGAIMIHGKRNGGRPTLGCISLEDHDVIELYPKIPFKTKVIIKP